MDDLSGLDWNSHTSVGQSHSNATQQKPFRPSPSPITSRSVTPSSAQVEGNQIQRTAKLPSIASAGPSNNSFSNLLSPQPTRPAAPTSLQEKQRQLQTERDRAKSGQDPYSGDDLKFWEGLGSGRDTPNTTDAANAQSSQNDDLLSAFSSSHPVDSSSHFPVPRPSSNGTAQKAPAGLGRTANVTNGGSTARIEAQTVVDEDDDPFGLGQTSARPSAHSSSLVADEDDILGDLGKPVDETARNQPRRSSTGNNGPSSRQSQEPNLRDKAIAELLEMGFSVKQAKDALAQTETGIDVQAAVGVILNAAHHKSSSKSQSQSRHRAPGPESQQTDRATRRSGDGAPSASVPAWLRSKDDRGHGESKTGQTIEEREIFQHASEIGTSFMKSANTFWKASQKRVAKAVAELQPEADASQPKWMRDAGSPEEPIPSRQTPPRPQGGPTLETELKRTTEAALLDSSRPEPERSGIRRPSQPAARDRERSMQSQAFKQQIPNGQPPREKPTTRTTGRVNRQMIEDETAQAYVSPARRKKQAPNPELPREPSLDIFSSEAPSSTTSRPNTALPTSVSGGSTNRPTLSSQPRTKQVSRTPPAVSASSLSTSHNRRRQGTAAFKRGDYPQAHTHYTAAITPLPSAHPVVIIIRCNRALTSLKTGDPRAAIEDADAAVETIGTSKGEGETIALGDEGEKPMREFYGKALMRKAEAFEQMEKWKDAADVWRRVVESGLGGAIAIQGRNRCEKGAGPSQSNGTVAPVKKTLPARPAKPRPTPSALADLNGSANGEAVKRLREKAAAEAATSDEAFSLTDAVDARLTQWKGAKADNLRALLASLETVLWPDAGWKKIGMGDIVLPNKVKIVYMKAIAKVHPDKLSQTATTEQKMISASVFATLNEAWDKFKSDNGM